MTLVDAASLRWAWGVIKCTEALHVVDATLQMARANFSNSPGPRTPGGCDATEARCNTKWVGPHASGFFLPLRNIHD